MKKNLGALWVYVRWVIFTDKRLNKKSLHLFKEMTYFYEKGWTKLERYVINKVIDKYTKLFNESSKKHE